MIWNLQLSNIRKKQYDNRKIYKFEDRETKKQYKLVIRFLLTYIKWNISFLILI